MPAHVVVSVPHSGTRSLVKHLHHFPHNHYPYDAKYRPAAHYRIHTPMRDPLAVAESWARRGKALSQLLLRYRYMFEYLTYVECIDADAPTFYRMEDIARLAGTDDADVSRGVTLPAVAEYQHAVLDHVVEPHRDFFASFGYNR